MLKRLQFNKIILASAFTFFGLVIGVFVKANTDFQFTYLENHIVTSLIVFGYMLILGLLRLAIAQNIFLLSTIFASIYLVIAMPKNPASFADLGIFLGWLIILGLGIIIGLTLEIFNHLRSK